MLAVALALTSLVVARVQAQEINFRIPAQPLANALKELSRQGDLQVLYNPDDLQGKNGNAVRGVLTPIEAASILLDQSGVSFSIQNDTLILDTGNIPPAAMSLDSTAISAPYLWITTEGTGSYTTGAVTIGKSAQSLREIPQSVTVITRQVMDDRNLTSLGQVMAQTPGMTFGQRNFGSHLFQSRGFVLGEESYLMDGIPGQAFNVTGWLPPDMTIYDRVEVLRGAPGILVGAGNPGGAVNLVRKRPLSEPAFAITTRAGSWDSYRLDLDGSGKLNEAGTLRGRFVAAQEDKHSYVDEFKSETSLLYGIAEADLTDDTTLALSLRHQAGKINGYSIFGLPRYSDGSALDFSRSSALVQDWNRHETQMNELFAEMTHQLNDGWSSKTSLIHSVGGFDQAAAYARGAVNPATQTGSIFRGVEFRHLHVSSTGLDTHMQGNFEAFGLDHQVTFGANWSKQDFTEKRAPVTVSVPYSLYDVDHHAFAEPVRPAWSSITDVIDERSGLYINTRLHLAQSLSLILGARASWYKYDFNYKLSSGDYLAQQNRVITPFAGLIYGLDERWSWYASYADIFLPQNNYQNFKGSLLDPALGANYETGMKGELFDKKLNLSFALFYIKQSDVSVEDTANSGKCSNNDALGTCYSNGTVQRSKGGEVEASGEVLPGLQVLAGYTYNLTRSSTGGPVSSETPRHLARLTTSYTLPGAWSRLTLGVGTSAQSGYQYKTSTGGTYGTTGRAIWNARASWKIDEHWKIGLNAENLFDRKYYYAADSLDRGNLYGDPRSYVMTLRGDF